MWLWLDYITPLYHLPHSSWVRGWVNRLPIFSRFGMTQLGIELSLLIVIVWECFQILWKLVQMTIKLLNKNSAFRKKFHQCFLNLGSIIAYLCTLCVLCVFGWLQCQFIKILVLIAQLMNFSIVLALSHVFRK